jgi:hypothetical protein
MEKDEIGVALWIHPGTLPPVWTALLFHFSFKIWKSAVILK